MFGASKRCPHCGGKLAASERLCPKCGKRLDAPVEPAADAPAAAADEAPDAPGPRWDRRDQFERVAAVLLPDESIEAVFDMKGGGTGFLGITDKRLVVYDKAFLRRMKAMVSIPYARVFAVASKDESGLLTGRGFWSSSELVITTAHGELEFEFRGAEKAHQAHQMIVRHLIG